MAKKKKNQNKKKVKSIFFRLLLIALIIISGYFLFSRFLLPAYYQYIKKPVTNIKEELIKEEVVKPEIVSEEDMVRIKLYFSDIDEMYLIAEDRELPKSSNLAKQIINELIKGSGYKNHYATIPENTILNEVYIVDDIVYVDLSQDIVLNHPGGSSSELMTVYSLVNSLTEMPVIKGVQLLIDGKHRETLAGHIDISMPLLRDEDWIKP